jgi:GGDEF domain-containing protein
MSNIQAKDLLKKIEELQEKVEELSRDDVYGIWTRAAFLQFCKVMPRGVRAIVFLDFDRIHDLNETIGYQEVDKKIRSTLDAGFRASDLVARWYSGDEIVILFDGDIELANKKMIELKESALRNGLSFKHNIGIWEVGKREADHVIEDLSKNLSRGDAQR